jgi:hypothetical protein
LQINHFNNFMIVWEKSFFVVKWKYYIHLWSIMNRIMFFLFIYSHSSNFLVLVIFSLLVIGSRLKICTEWRLNANYVFIPLPSHISPNIILMQLSFFILFIKSIPVYQGIKWFTYILIRPCWIKIGLVSVCIFVVSTVEVVFSNAK